MASIPYTCHHNDPRSQPDRRWSVEMGSISQTCQPDMLPLSIVDNCFKGIIVYDAFNLTAPGLSKWARFHTPVSLTSPRPSLTTPGLSEWAGFHTPVHIMTPTHNLTAPGLSKWRRFHTPVIIMSPALNLTAPGLSKWVRFQTPVTPKCFLSQSYAIILKELLLTILST